MKRVPMILDVDTGTDDAVAIILAHRLESVELRAVMTVAGNKGVNFTTDNTLRVIDLLNSDVPVYRGARLPMTATLIPGRRPDFPREGNSREDMAVHPDYLPLPAPKSAEREEDAVSAILRLLREARREGERIRVVTCGPLTNWGLALRAAPGLVEAIESFHIMGGGWRETNCTAAAEFNIWADPEAFQIVLDSGVPVTLCTLDATHSAALSVDLLPALEALGLPEADFTGQMIALRRDAYNAWQPMEDTRTVPIHDALPLAAFADPEVYTRVVHCHVSVDIGWSRADGRTVVDVENKEGLPANARVVLAADSKRFGDALLSCLAKGKRK